MDNILLFSGIAFIGTIFILVIILVVMKNKKMKKFKQMLEDLEYQKNEVSSTPVAPELAKVESYLKNEKLEVMYNDWKEKLNDIKEIKIPEINDLLIEAE